MNKKHILIGVAVVAVIAVAVGINKGKKSAPAAAAVKPALVVMVTTADTRQWPQRVQANGAVQAWQEAIVGAEVGGLRLAEVAVNVGDTVKKGQVLARFADELSQATLSQQIAARDEAQARFADAAGHLQRAQQVKDSGALSAQELQQLATSADSARAQLKSAEARLAAEQLRLNYTRVLAPDDGLISSRSATVGAVMQAGGELFRLIRQSKLEWRAELPDNALPGVKIGQKVRVSVGSDSLSGQVVRIAPTIDPQSRNGLVYVALPPHAQLRAGQFVQGDFDLGAAAASTLPDSAVVMRDGFAYVYVLGKDNRVQQQKVTLGRRADNRVEIRSGLPAQASVVNSGAGFLNDGDLVQVSR